MTKLKTILIGVVVLVAATLLLWQETRLQRANSENQQLKAQVTQMAALRQRVEQLQKAQVDQAELTRLQAAEEKTRSELARLRGKASGVNRAEAETAQLRAELQRKTEEGEATNEFTGAMSEMMKSAMSQQVNGQIGRMKAALNLTPDQEEAIRAILNKQAELNAATVGRVLSGKLKPDEMAKLQREAGNPEEQIKALLTPDQLSRYPEYKNEEAASNARMAVTGEMMQMQTMLGLSTEQQDKASTALYEVFRQQLTGQTAAQNPPTGASSTEMMQQFFDQKSKALEGILTPEQLQNYRQLQESQLKMIRTLTPAKN
jgi:hypothetical protein